MERASKLKQWEERNLLAEQEKNLPEQERNLIVEQENNLLAEHESHIKKPFTAATSVPNRSFEPRETTIGRCKNSDALPEGAVRISDSVVLARFHQVISKSQDFKDMWTLKNAPHLLAGLSGASGLAINLLMRRRIGLTSSAISSSLPCVVIPAGATLAFQDRLMDRVLIKSIDSTAFASLKCINYQLTLGFLFPSVMAYFGTVSLTRLYTDKWIPPLRDIKATKKWTLDTLRPAKHKFACILVANAVLGLALGALMVHQAPNVWNQFNYVETLDTSLNEVKPGFDSVSSAQLHGPPRDKDEVATSPRELSARQDTASSIQEQAGRLQGLSS